MNFDPIQQFKRSMSVMNRAICTSAIPSVVRTISVCHFVAALALLSLATRFASADPISIGLTQVGSPIWKPVDFQLFTAPAAPFPDAFFDTLDLLLPLEGPGVATYTPHAGPYETELSTNAAAAGLVNQQVFPESAILLNPNGVYFMYMMMPVPGVIGSSRDFASGPVIPNSLLPIHSHAEMWIDGIMVEELQDQDFNPRAGDLPFDGASHRAPSQVVWYPWADPSAGPLGSHEIRWSLIDNQGNGWEMSAPFSVVPEPATFALAATTILGIAIFPRSRRKR
jgi:hypothetical protein